MTTQVKELKQDTIEQSIFKSMAKTFGYSVSETFVTCEHCHKRLMFAATGHITDRMVSHARQHAMVQ